MIGDGDGDGDGDEKEFNNFERTNRKTRVSS